MHIERTKKHVKRHIMRIEDVASRVTIMENIFRLLFVHAEDRKQAATNSAAAAATAATAYVYISDAHLSTVVLELLNICLKKTIRTNNERQNNQNSQNNQNKETKKSNTQEMNDNSTERAKRLSQFVEEGLERVNGTSKIQKIEM